MTHRHWNYRGGLVVATLGLALAGCGDSSGTTEASASGGQSTGSTSSSTATPTSSGSSSGGETPTTTDIGTASAGQTSSTDPGTSTTADPTMVSSSTTMDPTDSTTGTTTGVQPETTGTTSTSDGTTMAEGSSSTGNDDSTTGPPPKCEPGDGMGMGKVEKSYIWIASENTNDVSKVDTLTMTELARYRTGPAGVESPSRTAVSADGRYVVVNNRQTGRSTMVAANVEDCVDKNANGQIETSQNKGDLLAFGSDECVIWSITHPFQGQWQHGPRGVTWTPGTWSYEECKYVEPKVWLGYMSNAGGNTVHLVRVDGVTGTVEETIPVPNWNGSGFSPYGAALDPEFRPWFSSLRGEFVRVNTDEVPVTVTRYTPPNNVQSYGFTVDKDGNPWFGGNCGAVTAFDVDSETYVPVPGTEAGCWRGVTGDAKYLWAANNAPCGFAQIDLETRTLVNNWTSNPCNTSIGFSIDSEKKVWLVDQGGFAFKFDPENVPGMQKIDVLGSHYVYSDMTGGQVASILPQ